MKAAYINQTGPPENIIYGDLPKPKPAGKEALVKVGAVDEIRHKHKDKFVASIHAVLLNPLELFPDKLLRRSENIRLTVFMLVPLRQ